MMKNTIETNRFNNTIQKHFAPHSLLNRTGFIRLFLIFFISLFSFSSYSKGKTRITERGSSLFYRSWRYPQITDNQKEKENDELAKDSIIITIPDSTFIAKNDSIGNDDILDDNEISSKGNDEEDKPTDNLIMPEVCVLYFKFDQSNYTHDYTAEIDTILQFIDYHKGENFLLTAHTDERGSVAYNQALSERRAKQLYKTLVERGVDPKRLTCIGRSELEPSIRNAKTEREHQLNRRVVITVKE